jgi:hypothetical protein
MYIYKEIEREYEVVHMHKIYVKKKNTTKHVYNDLWILEKFKNSFK